MGSTRRNIRGLFRELMELTDGNEELKTDEVEVHFFVDDVRRLTVSHCLGYWELVDTTGKMARIWGVAQSEVQMKCNRKGQPRCFDYIDPLKVLIGYQIISDPDTRSALWQLLEERSKKT